MVFFIQDKFYIGSYIFDTISIQIYKLFVNLQNCIPKGEKNSIKNAEEDSNGYDLLKGDDCLKPIKKFVNGQDSTPKQYTKIMQNCKKQWKKCKKTDVKMRGNDYNIKKC